MKMEGQEGKVSTRRGPTRQDRVSWALPDNGRSYHELLRLEKVVCGAVSTHTTDTTLHPH